MHYGLCESSGSTGGSLGLNLLQSFPVQIFVTAQFQGSFGISGRDQLTVFRYKNKCN